MRRTILMLEDDGDRIRRFRAILLAREPSLSLVIWRDAGAMIREVEAMLPSACLISLDHDLEPEPGGAGDPGDGLQVAKVLAALPPVCPVIVHSSNVRRSTWMEGEFDLGGWSCRTAAPIGEGWIEEYWIAIVRESLLQPPG